MYVLVGDVTYEAKITLVKGTIIDEGIKITRVYAEDDEENTYVLNVVEGIFKRKEEQENVIIGKQVRSIVVTERYNKARTRHIDYFQQQFARKSARISAVGVGGEDS